MKTRRYIYGNGQPVHGPIRPWWRFSYDGNSGFAQGVRALVALFIIVAVVWTLAVMLIRAA